MTAQIEAVSAPPAMPPDLPFSPLVPYSSPVYTFCETSSIKPLSPRIMPLIDHPDALIREPIRKGPRHSFEGIVYKLITGMQKTTDLTREGLASTMEYLDEVHQIELEAYLKTSREISAVNRKTGFVQMLKQTAFCLAAAAAIVVGVIVLASNPFTVAAIPALIGGASLILSGGATLIGQALLDSHRYADVGMALTLVGSAFGILGGGYAFYSGLVGFDLIYRLIGAAAGVSTAIAGMAEGVLHRETALLRMEKTQHDKMKDEERNQFATISKLVRESASDALDSTRTLRVVVAALVKEYKLMNSINMRG